MVEKLVTSFEKGEGQEYIFSVYFPSEDLHLWYFKTYKMNDMKEKTGYGLYGHLLVLSSCHTGKQITASGLQRKDFQTEVNGQHTDLFTLSNKQGMEVCITNYGARVVSILVPDRNGKREDVVCGFSTITEYMEQRQNFGSTVGL